MQNFELYARRLRKNKVANSKYVDWNKSLRKDELGRLPEGTTVNVDTVEGNVLILEMDIKGLVANGTFRCQKTQYSFTQFNGLTLDQVALLFNTGPLAKLIIISS